MRGKYQSCQIPPKTSRTVAATKTTQMYHSTKAHVHAPVALTSEAMRDFRLSVRNDPMIAPFTIPSDCKITVSHISDAIARSRCLDLNSGPLLKMQTLTTLVAQVHECHQTTRKATHLAVLRDARHHIYKDNYQPRRSKLTVSYRDQFVKRCIESPLFFAVYLGGQYTDESVVAALISTPLHFCQSINDRLWQSH